jgi:voltage-gated potassium channel Kch
MAEGAEEQRPVPTAQHVVVAGLGNVGYWVCRLLQEAGIPVVVVGEADPANPDEMRVATLLEERAVPRVARSPRSAQVLAGVNVETALALLACEENDLRNVETVLLAHEMNPRLRIVARITNPLLADQLATAIPTVTPLSPAALCADRFVEDCAIGSVVHTIPRTRPPLRVVERAAVYSCTVEELVEHAEPIAVRRVGGEPVFAPAKDTPMSPGDVLSMIGELPDDSPHDWSLASGRLRSRLRAARRLWSALYADLGRPLRLALTGVLVLIVIATVVLRIWYLKQVPQANGGHRSFTGLDALYFTVTVITVGFGDFSFAGESTGVEVFGIALILAGATAMTLVYAFVTNFLVSQRLPDVVGRRQRVDLYDHVIVCGLGTVGLAVVEQLVARNEPVAVIEVDPNKRYLDQARALGVPVLLGDARGLATLERANLGKARAVVALTSTDQTNVEIALTVRAATTAGEHEGERARVVLRLFDETLAERIETHFDIHRARSVSALVAPHFVARALDLPVVSVCPVGRLALLVTADPQPPGPPVPGISSVYSGSTFYLVGPLALHLKIRRRTSPGHGIGSEG